MIIQEIQASNCTPQTIVIGRRGTYDTMQIAFDLSFLIKNYGSGTAVLAIKRSQDESAYPAIITQEDATLLWTVNETDTAYVGSGECQLMWYVDGGLAKTIIYPIVVMRDILSTAEEPPDGYENWIEHMTGLGAKTEQNAQNAAQSASDAESAKDEAITAKEAAESAKEAAETAVTHYPKIENNYWMVWDSTSQSYVSTGIQAGGEDGYSPEITITSITGGHRVIITDKDHPQGQSFDVMDGQGGGTSNYADLSNKPKINNVELNGNKTAHDLGLAAQSDIPTVPVQSVNGKTGAVNLASGDIAYDESATYQAGSVGAELQEQNRQLSDLEDTVSTTQIINTASGAIASFDDGADEQPVKKLVAQIEPVQDLHGQDSPYPAGGWKNLLNTVLIAGTPSDTEFSNATKRTFTVGTYIDGLTNNNYFKKHATAVSVAENRVAFTTDARAYGISIPLVGLTPGSQYTVSASITNGRIGLSFYAEDGTWISGSTAVATAYYTATVPTNAYYTLVIFNGSAEDVESIFTNIQLELGSSATSFAPYENICPISGWTGAEVTRTGENLASFTDGYTIGLNGLPTGYVKRSATTTPILIKSGATYKGICSGTNVFLIYSVLDANNALVRRQTAVTSGTVLDTSDGKYLYVCGYDSADTNTITAEGNGLMVVVGSESDRSYAPYTGNQISVNWETEAGTVYGGEDEVISGKLKSTMGMVDLGTLNWTLMPNDKHLFYAAISGIKPNEIPNVAANIKSDRYKTVSASAAFGATQDCVIGQGITGIIGNVYIMVVNRAYSDAASFKTAMSGAQLVYEIAEPVEYTLTENEVETLYGTNNIWSSTGDTEVTYPCDTRLYIDNKITQAIANALNS